MPELKYYDQPVVDCSDFDRFVEEVYGRRYSTVSGMRGDDRLGHYTYHFVDVEQWLMDKQWEEFEEGLREWQKMKEKYPQYYSDSDVPATFEEWSKLEGYDARNNSPSIEEMVYHLRMDGYEVPAEFTVLVDW